jgi:ubiquinone/menaquinone biosynthesis C-methylase UbiE
MNPHEHHYRYSDDDRKSWQDPDSILSGIGLRPGMTFVDVGCGHGFFAIPAAKIVGVSGKVIGIDVNAEALQSIKDSMTRERIKNLETFLGKAEEVIPCKGCADMVFFGIVLHDFQDPYQVLTNAKAMLKPEGLLVNLDWKKEETAGMGPPLSIRFDEKHAASMITSRGFRIISTTRSGKYHYILTAKLME